MYNKDIRKLLIAFLNAIIFILLAINLAKIAYSENIYKIVGLLLFLVVGIYFLMHKGNLSFGSLIILLLPFWNLPVYGEYLNMDRAIVLVGLTFAFSRNQNRAIFFTKESFLLMILVLLMTISGLIASDFDRARNIWLSFLTNTFLLYILTNAFIIEINQVKSIYNAWIIMGVISAILTILQVLFGQFFLFGKLYNPAAVEIFYDYKMEGGGNSGFGLFMHRGYNAIFLCGAFIIALLKIFDKRWKAIWMVPVLVLLCIAIVMSGSRTGVYLLLFSVVLVMLLNNYVSTKIKDLGINLISVLCIFFLAYEVATDSPILISKIEKGTLARFNAVQNETHEGRLRLWNVMLARMGSPLNPIGIGIGETAKFRDVIDIHNAYLEILVEVGFIGLVVWMLFVWRGIVLSYRLLLFMKKTRCYDETIIISIVFLLLILQNLIIGMSIERGDPLIVLPFALIAALARLHNIRENKTLLSST